MANESKRPLAKALFTQYSVGPGLIEGWWAQPDGDAIRVHRKDGSSKLVTIGEELPIGRVKLDGPLLKVGERSLPYFNTEEKGLKLLEGYVRRTDKKKDGPKSFAAELPSGTRQIFEGQAPKGLDIVTVLDEGHVKCGKHIIPVASKEYELLLLVQQEAEKGGFRAYMNYKEPGSSRNMRDGIRGVYIKAKGKEPAKFCEVGPDGETYPTAVFWSTRGRKPKPKDIKQTVDDMVAFGVSREDAEKDVEYAITEHDARHEGLVQNIDYCKKRNKKAVEQGGKPLKAGYVRKAIQDGFVSYENAQTKFANVQSRPLDLAIREGAVYNGIQDIENKYERMKKELSDSGIDDAVLEDHWEFSPDDPEKVEEFNKELYQLQNNGWSSRLFAFLSGAQTMHRNMEAQPGHKYQAESKGP